MEDYIMTSIETDVEFVDNASDSYMSDEEREYWIDKEEGVTDEETTFICDCCEETFNEEEMVIGANTDGICGTEEDYCKSCNDLTEEQREMIQEEEIEPCDDIAIDNAFNSLFGKTIKETKSIRRATKKAQVVVLPTYKGVVSRIEENANRLANHFNHQGVK